MAGDAVGWHVEPDAAGYGLLAEYYEAVVGSCLASETPDALDDVVARFVDPVNAAFAQSADPAQAVETVLWAAWTAVVGAAEACTGAAQQRLVELVTGIRGQDVPERADGRRECRVWDLRVHADLPVFGAQMREEWDVSRADGAGPEAWVNLNAFAARLTAAGVDFSLYALWTLRNCLEEEGSASPTEFAAAAHWFTICGPLLASHMAQGYAPAHWGAAARVGRMCAQQGITQAGFNSRRWEFWRTQLEAHAAGQDTAARATLAAFTRAAA